MAAADDDPYADLAPSADPYADLAAQKPAEEELKNSPFPEKPGTSQASIQLPEMAAPKGGGTRAFLPEGDAKQTAKNLGVTAAMLMTSDPAEIAKMLVAQNPDVGIEYAPDGTVIAANNKTGKRAIINRPGISYMDVLQMLGLTAAFTPAGRVATGAGLVGREVAKKAITETAKKAALKEATAASAGNMAVGSGLTEGVIQSGQKLAGGDFNPGDIALSTIGGALPEYIAQPVARFATKIPEMIAGKANEIAPQTVRQALDYAEQTGKKIATSDALEPFLTAPMRIWLKMSERIPVVGLGSLRVQQQAQRADTLTEVASKYGINVDTELGQDVAQSFIQRMINQRFWGKNANPTAEQLGRAWEKEGAQITDSVLAKHVSQGNITSDVVDKVLDSGNRLRISQLYAKLTPEGQRATRQNFIAKGLTKAGWRPEAPEQADPTAFAEYLDTPQARKTMDVLFSPLDRTALSGAREYLKITQKAQSAGKGMGMAASGEKGGIMAMLAHITLLGGFAAHAVESEPMRDQFIKLAHAKGNEKATQAAMDELRPMVQAIGQQYRQKSSDVPMPDLNQEITPDMIKKKSAATMEQLKDAAASSGSTVANLPHRLAQMFQ